MNEQEVLQQHIVNLVILRDTYTDYIDMFREYLSNIIQDYEEGYCNETETYMNLYKLSCTVNGFGIEVYEKISFALDCWLRYSDINLSKNNESDKNYDRSLRKLKSKGKLVGQSCEKLLEFRQARNAISHNKELQFMTYIIRMQDDICKLINIILDLLYARLKGDFDLEDYLKQELDRVIPILEEFNLYEYKLTLTKIK